MNDQTPQLRKCKKCGQSQDPKEFSWGYHFEPGKDHTWCRTCQFKAVTR